VLDSFPNLEALWIVEPKGGLFGLKVGLVKELFIGRQGDASECAFENAPDSALLLANPGGGADVDSLLDGTLAKPILTTEPEISRPLSSLRATIASSNFTKFTKPQFL
jgi:hypothetical protein